MPAQSRPWWVGCGGLLGGWGRRGAQRRAGPHDEQRHGDDRRSGGPAHAAVRVAGLRRDRLALPARWHDLLAGWLEAQDWKTASGDPVKNKEIWVQLAAAASDHEQVRWHWVKGHIGHALNERADVLAVAARRNAARSGR